MTTLAINIKDNSVEKVRWLLDHFSEQELEIIDINDLEDLKLIEQTRVESSEDAEEFFKRES